jgi:hypothetical protein
VELDGVLPDGVQIPFPVLKQEKGAYTFKLDREEDSSDLLRFFLQQPARIVRFEEILPSFNEIFIQRVAENGNDCLINAISPSYVKTVTHYQARILSRV